MADYYERLVSAALTTSRATLYTVPASTKVVIRHAVLINTSAADVTVQLWIHGVKYVDAAVIPAHDEVFQEVSMWVVHAAELIEAQASAAGVQCEMHGVREA
jgi:hypothetical protein